MRNRARRALLSAAALFAAAPGFPIDAPSPFRDVVESAIPAAAGQRVLHPLRDRALGWTPNPPACAPPNLFLDVPETSAFCRWIEELASRGIVTGCGGGSYCPSAAVTREQMSVFLGVTFGLALYGL